MRVRWPGSKVIPGTCLACRFQSKKELICVEVDLLCWYMRHIYLRICIRIHICNGICIYVKLDFEEARIGMTTGVKVASYRVATEKWPRISLRRKIVVNSLNYQPFYTLTVEKIQPLQWTFCTLTHVSMFMIRLNYQPFYTLTVAKIHPLQWTA